MIEPALLCGGRYELGPVIGRGGMAEVRSGRDTRLDRPVAVKFLRPEMAHQPGVRSRFETEARLAARLSHPHVVAVYDSGETDGVPFIVMERLPGQTLHDRLRSGPLPVAEVRTMAIQVLGALQAAHDAGILHRDIKPGNVMVAAGGGWKVGDFGIAKALEVDQQDLTATGLLIGTPAYLAPERFFGSPATVASDLYAAAVVLYEVLAGRKPFHTDRADAWAAAVAGAAAEPLETLRPEVDPALAAAIRRAMAKDPADRFASAAQMAAVIDGQVEAGRAAAPAGGTVGGAVGGWGPPAAPGGGGPAWTPDGRTTRVLDQRRAAGPATEVLPPAGRAGRPAGLPLGRLRSSRPGRRLAAAGVAALVVIVIAVVALSGRHAGTNSPPPTTSATPATSAPAATPTTSAPSGGAGLPGPLDRALQNLEHQVTRGR
ncbi:MAG TPA: serine/threonine-protein kinase [Acidimicrobiales bacterium]|nr:serine/threonine-protein kinase [Acidimicrobiales bacterium]